MEEALITQIAEQLRLNPRQVKATAALLDEGATIPFIARYRKEATGSLDEVAVAAIRDTLQALRELEKRRASILATLEELGKLTPELKARIDAAGTMTVLEDIYLPFRPKRRTRASIAREKGLEPLADKISSQADLDLTQEAALFVDETKGVGSVEEALSGARDIIAERIAEDERARARLRVLFATKGMFRARVTSGKEYEGAKFKDYFDWSESAAKAPSHRVLALRRGEEEDVLALRLTPPEDEAITLLEMLFLKASNDSARQVDLAVHDCYKRLLMPSMETEAKGETKRRADAEAIRVFGDNLRQLLLQPPLGRRNVMAIDPGFRTGCKVACLDGQGKPLRWETVYPHNGSAENLKKAGDVIRRLCDEFDVEAMAIGNGTAGRETETFVKRLGLPAKIRIVMVNESGASVYSASEGAREEFPDLDITVRGAISIGRRLIDPLAELVKIDPKSIGVGQYQHDVDQKLLRRGLDDVVTSCVNHVGVEVNTASRELLTYVSGLGPQLAANIVAFRNEHGPFGKRAGLKKVPKLGPRAFEQGAGFLRIRDGKEPLDGTAVHPESYHIVEQMARDLGVSVHDLIKKPELRGRIDPSAYVTEKAGLPTINDILSELAKPGRDPRESFDPVSFAEGVEKMEDLKPGMQLPGVVTNVTAFGAFVDIGVHQDGLVHISELSDGYVKSPSDVVKVQQKVSVTVLNVDLARKRIALSMKKGSQHTFTQNV